MALVLVTGASGFIGRVVCAHLRAGGHTVRCAGRHRPKDAADDEDWIEWGDDPAQLSDAACDAALAGCDAVIHLAGRAHVLRDEVADAALEFRRANVDFTSALARGAVRTGVARFVFVSSIGVCGDWSTSVLSADDVPRPQSLYAFSKLQAEQALRAITADSATHFCIVRPPLVYGPGCPGNLARLVRLVARGVPLPLGAVHNRRSLVGVDDLADLLVLCAFEPNATDQVFLCAHDDDVSSAEIARLVGAGLGKPARIVDVPVFWLSLGARLLGKRDVQRFFADLKVDSAKTRLLLGWAPRGTLREGLRNMGAAFKTERTRSGTQRSL